MQTWPALNIVQSGVLSPQRQTTPATGVRTAVAVIGWAKPAVFAASILESLNAEQKRGEIQARPRQ
jgi:hypothetical protein